MGGDIRLWNLKTPLMHVAFAVETPGAMSGDTALLGLVPHIYGRFHRSEHELGQHAIHRLVKTHSNIDYGTPTNTPFHHKTVETMSPFHLTYEDTGLLGSYLVGRQMMSNPGLAKTMTDSLEAQMNDFARLGAKTVDEHELAQAKVSFKAQLMFNMDGAHNSAKDLARQTFLFGRRVPLEEWFERIDDISAGNVHETLGHYVIHRRPVLSFYGYFSGTPNYDMLKDNLCKYAL